MLRKVFILLMALNIVVSRRYTVNSARQYERSSPSRYTSYNYEGSRNSRQMILPGGYYRQNLMPTIQGRNVPLVPMGNIGNKVVYGVPRQYMTEEMMPFFRAMELRFSSPGLSSEYHGDMDMCFIPTQQQTLIPCNALYQTY